MNAQVVLARARRAGATTGRPAADGPPEVHAYRVGEEGSPLWESACGIRLAERDAEIVEGFTGTPCTACFLTAIMAGDTTPITRTELDPPPRLELANGATFPVRYVASWRERVIHLPDSNPPSTELDGEPVVMARCGNLGWPTTSPAGWHLCEECDQLPNERHTRPATSGPPNPFPVEVTPLATGAGEEVDPLPEPEQHE